MAETYEAWLHSLGLTTRRLYCLLFLALFVQLFLDAYTGAVGLLVMDGAKVLQRLQLWRVVTSAFLFPVLHILVLAVDVPLLYTLIDRTERNDYIGDDPSRPQPRGATQVPERVLARGGAAGCHWHMLLLLAVVHALSAGTGMHFPAVVFCCEAGLLLLWVLRRPAGYTVTFDLFSLLRVPVPAAALPPALFALHVLTGTDAAYDAIGLAAGAAVYLATDGALREPLAIVARPPAWFASLVFAWA